MPRQVLTFLFIFLIVMFGMRACAPKETMPPVLATEKAPAPEAESITLNNGVVLARDGSVLSIKQAGAPVVMPVAPWRRPLQIYVRLKSGEKRIIPTKAWKSTETDTGREFVYEEDQLKITKRLVPAENTLSMELTVVDASEKIEGIEVDAASGVLLPETGAADEPGVFHRFSGAKLDFLTFTDLVQKREQRRTDLLKQLRAGTEVKPDYYLRKLLEPGQSIERFGVLGQDHYLMLEQLANARAVNVDVYRLKRTGTEENQIETWLSMDLVEGKFTGAFKMRWGTRAELGTIETPLGKKTETKESKTYRLDNDTLRVEFSDRGASITSLWLKKYSLHVGEAPSEENWVQMIRDAVPVRHRSLSMYADPERYDARLAQQVWTATQASDGKSIKFALTTPSGFEFTKVVRLPEEDRYDLAVTVRVRRPSSSSDASVVYTLVGPAGSYLEDSYRGIIGASPASGLLIERDGGESDDEYIESIAKEDEPFAHSYDKDYTRGFLRAVGVRGAFFLCALTTEERTDSKGRPAGNVTEARVNLLELTQEIKRPNGDTSRESLKGQITCAVPFDGGEAVSEYSLYAGPNRRSDLKPLQIQEAVDFGFFGGIGRLLMWLMKALQGLLGSFGLAIMFMTLIVRALLMPVSYRTQLGMMRYSKRIQKIKPQLDELEKRHGGNRRKLNEERMKIMRENKVGFPLGCLMIFFQIPIWFALFAALRVEFSLRHEPFLWAIDLTMPDRLFPIGLWVVDYFNLLPICMLVLWVIQQKLAPSPGGDDPNVKMQMKMVRFMPYIFFFFLYKYAAALSVYMCVSSAWGIVEAKFVRKAVKRAEDGDAALPAKT